MVMGKAGRAVAISCVIAVCAGGEGFVAAQGGPTCRTVPTTQTQTMGSGAFKAQASTKCAFDAGTNSFACTIQYSDSTGANTTTVQTFAYASKAVFVDEIAVVPPLQRASSVTVTGTGRAPETTTYEYNGHRLTKETLPGAVTTYTAWDNSGRPTAGSSVLATNTNTLSIAYDDARRTRTTTSTTNGLATVCTITYDVNGNPIAQTCSGGGVVSGGTSTITATERICK